MCSQEGYRTLANSDTPAELDGQPLATPVGESKSGQSATLTLADPIVLVLANGDTPSAISNARGHLFETFVAHLLHTFGYNKPRTDRLNEVSAGIELDVSADHELTKQPAVVECKAYTSPVTAALLGTFHSKLVTRRYREPTTQGFFVAIPRLTANAKEQADLISGHDPGFTVLTAQSIVDLLANRGAISDCPIANVITSDPAVVVTEHGIHAACLQLDADTRTPSRVLVWAAEGSTPAPVLEAVAQHPYSQGVPVADARKPRTVPIEHSVDPAAVIVTVRGSRSDFEYQLPASPKYFVGRKRIVESLKAALDEHAGVVVLNAQSGWGKSSAALRLQAITDDKGGFSVIIDSRTASHRRFVVDALSYAAQGAEDAGILVLPKDVSWATLPSALRTLSEASWKRGKLVVFFDQFENVFRDQELTREFRDLALSARDLADRILVGFAWKTDLVGWTENHPYQLRDEIRAHATILTLGPMGAPEIDTLLRRLEKALGQPVARDLKTRLREYSQGFPWLFKKLAGHLLREVKSGVTQERLASEALNVQSLFDADLAELSPLEQDALRHVARYAPIAIGEVLERVSAPVLETLVNRRLVVQVGERLDTYWDIFRDYLVNGRIPVEDSYILRQTPGSVARLLREVLRDGGDSSTRDIADRHGTSENAVFNLSRELRLLGATAYEPNRVRLLPDIWNAENREEELRRRVFAALRRHRAYSTFTALYERTGTVNASTFANELPNAFPAVEVTESTWASYARAYLLWFEYAGLATQVSGSWSVAADGTVGVGELLGRRLVRRIKGGFPHGPVGPALDLIIQATEYEIRRRPENRRALQTLLALGALEETVEGKYRLTRSNLVANGGFNQDELRELMLAVPGVLAGIDALRKNPSARPEVVGNAIKAALSADWTDGTTVGIGKHMRAWARAAGLAVEKI
jgi:hypothetical protein